LPDTPRLWQLSSGSEFNVVFVNLTVPDDVRRTLMRLAVTEQLVEKGGKYTLPAGEAEQG
jgi:hypothetical protein